LVEDCEGFEVSVYQGSNCLGAAFDASPPQGCASLAGPGITAESVSVEVGEGVPVGGCEVIGGGDLVDLDDPKPASSLAVCAGDLGDFGPCSDSEGVCVALPEEPLFAKVCVWKDGDVACPAAFPSKNVVYEGWNDTRNCGGCDCGINPLASGCWPILGLYGNSFCGDGGNGPSEVAPGECGAISSQVLSFSYELLTFDALAECFGANAPPVGGVFPVNPKTVCCSSGGG
jgi:hypothetical protein